MEQGSPRPAARSRRIAITVQYDGSAFNGWQAQLGGRTVQDEIEKAIRVLLKEETRVVASGRTDSGVHALGQVVHFNTDSDISLQRLCIGMNGILPRDMAVVNGYDVPSDFHARFGPVEREYRYLIHNHPLRTPFMMYRAMWVQEKLDLKYLRAVAAYCTGEMDFSSFCKKREAKEKNTVRRIDRITVEREVDLIRIEIVGNAFLHNMVRILVGTMLKMHRNSMEPESVGDILAACDRESSGATAPPYGLYLVRVSYDPPLSSMKSAF
ncbi:MAG TPA: tRNA pseudouridine(38-40) synthase TruA [Spirochaetota bacterium]|nr:tRNA pseudouridine(38-40) synthase TruA [Spirochaetota bacterium]